MYTIPDEINLRAISTDAYRSPDFEQRNIRVFVLRLDKIHPEIAGNKWFKLKYWMEQAAREEKTTLLTFGGAYSNHILATAALAHLQQWRSLGIIRGEKPAVLSHTLLQAEKYGMQLVHISRSVYHDKDKPGAIRFYQDQYPHALIIPEGGAGPPGIRGSGEILSLLPQDHFSHILCAVGTGTTFTGISRAAAPFQKVWGIAVTKGLTGVSGDLFHQFHFGGYAKKTKELIGFMNDLYRSNQIPTDFVYTAKLFYAARDLALNGYFESGSRVLLIHSGGLQGNGSLPAGTLQF
jgi:1-aminocyclopropane-1-carboxylate deaminase